jgi:type II secretory pathway pseudopilin PulG
MLVTDTTPTRTPRRRESPQQQQQPTPGRGELGFALVEIMAAMTILVIVLVSFSTLLVDSLTAALNSKQSQVAASIASDMIENAKAIGLVALNSDLGTFSLTPSAFGSIPVPVPIRTALPTSASVTVASTDFRQRFTMAADGYTYTVIPTVIIGAGTPDKVTVQVTWLPAGSYSTTTLIGQ